MSFDEDFTTIAYLPNGHNEPEAVAIKDNERIIDVNLRIDEDDIESRLSGLSGKHYRTLQQDPDAQMHFLARFMVDGDGRYLSQEEAISILDELNVGQIMEAFKELMIALPQAAAPKKSLKQSTKAHISTYR